MEEVFIFIYAKKGKIKALGIEESKRINESLISDGWRHTQTLVICMWIEFIHNLCKPEDLLNELKSLSKK
jgi:hypothetical protein